MVAGPAARETREDVISRDGQPAIREQSPERKTSPMPATTTFCATCQRTAYISDGDQLACPVCASPLVLTESEVLRKQRIALNEDAFRKVNEAINRAAGGSPSEEALEFVCECGRRECRDTIPVSPDEYEVVRKDPAAFIIRPEHDAPDAEDVIDRRSDHWVVKKVGFAKDLVEDLDQRFH